MLRDADGTGENLQMKLGSNSQYKDFLVKKIKSWQKKHRIWICRSSMSTGLCWIECKYKSRNIIIESSYLLKLTSIMRFNHYEEIKTLVLFKNRIFRIFGIQDNFVQNTMTWKSFKKGESIHSVVDNKSQYGSKIN